MSCSANHIDASKTSSHVQHVIFATPTLSPSALAYMTASVSQHRHRLRREEEMKTLSVIAEGRLPQDRDPTYPTDTNVMTAFASEMLR